jgi:hypothetical protein
MLSMGSSGGSSAAAAAAAAALLPPALLRLLPLDSAPSAGPASGPRSEIWKLVPFRSNQVAVSSSLTTKFRKSEASSPASRSSTA